MIAARMARTPAYQETIEEMEKELTKVIEDFDRAVDVEALCLAKESGKHPLPQSSAGSFSVVCVEQKLLLKRLKCVETGYNRTLCCMEGTREFLLSHITAWATDGSAQTGANNTYWIYGLPGIGKTSLAHSICASLHDEKHLAGGFFCQRDDPNLSQPRNILPSLIYTLADSFPPFRIVVAERLRSDTKLTPESMKDSLLLDCIRALPRHPMHALVFVIDALDECGDDQSRRILLRVLTDAAIQAPWLKIVITSRPEVDIQRFFDSPAQSPPLRYDLTTDEKATSDLRIFAQSRFTRLALKRHLQSPWPEPSLLDGVISRAAGLFIFIKTVALALEQCKDPTESLKAILEGSDRTGLISPYGLYSSIVKTRILHSNSEFQRMIGVLLATAPYRPLCEEAIAELAEVDLSHVKTWVDDLSSLLYRDERVNRAIRVRHLSISDFFVSSDCPRDYQVNLQDANTQLGIACLKIMVSQLHFNICRLEDSRFANIDVKDLPSRIQDNISDPLQYSSRYWSNHVCFTPDNGHQHMWSSLEQFFGGLYPLFWIEILSLMGIVPIGAPSLRRVIRWTKVSTTPSSR